MTPENMHLNSFMLSLGLKPGRCLRRRFFMSRLTEQEQQEILRFIEADKPLPDNGIDGRNWRFGLPHSWRIAPTWCLTRRTT